MIVDLILEAGVALGSAPGCRSSTIERPFGMISRFQTRSTRDWPNAIWRRNWPIRRAPCGISQKLGPSDYR